ncbi:unnamed protein product [Boreogadus saida]
MLPEEGLLSRHLFFSPSVDLAEAIDLFGAGVPDAQDSDEHFEVDDVASLDDVFPCSASEFSRSGASTKATIVPRERLRRMADLFGGECFRTLSSSRRDNQCPLFPPVQHLFTAAGGDPSTLKAPKQITGLTDRVFVFASQSAAAVNNIALLSSALVSLSAGREAYGPEEAARWLTVSRFSSAILQLCQPQASLVQGPLAPDGLFGPRFSEVLAHQQSVRENRSRFGAIFTGSSHQQAGRKRGPGRFQRSRGPPPPPTPMPQQQSQQQPGRAAPRGQKFRKLAPTFSYPNNKEKKCRSTERQYILP